MRLKVKKSTLLRAIKKAIARLETEQSQAQLLKDSRWKIEREKEQSFIPENLKFFAPYETSIRFGCATGNSNESMIVTARYSIPVELPDTSSLKMGYEYNRIISNLLRYEKAVTAYEDDVISGSNLKEIIDYLDLDDLT